MAENSENMILRSLAGRNLLFDQTDQAIYEIDDFSAAVWRYLDDGVNQTEMVSRLVTPGSDAKAMTAALDASLAALQPLRSRRLPSEERQPPRSAASAKTSPLEPEAGSCRMTFAIGGVHAGVSLPNSLVEQVQHLFGYLESDDGDPDFDIGVRTCGEKIELVRSGRPDWTCDKSEFLPLLKADLLDGVLAFANYEIAFHAGSVARGDEACLLVGSPGAGKTTLALAMATSGWQLQGDDVVLMRSDGRVTGLPFPPAVKEGSWTLLAGAWPEIVKEPIYRRPDGQMVRFARGIVAATTDRPRIANIILLDRRHSGGSLLEPVDPTAILAALIAEGASRDERLSPSGFDSLVGALRAARCHSLRYSDFREAAVLLHDL